MSMKKLWWISRHCICIEGAPVRTVVRNGCRSHELNGPWSPLSRHVEKTRLCEISSPPPKPSLALMPARGPLKKTLPETSDCAVLACTKKALVRVRVSVRVRVWVWVRVRILGRGLVQGVGRGSGLGSESGFGLGSGSGLGQGWG